MLHSRTEGAIAERNAFAQRAEPNNKFSALQISLLFDEICRWQASQQPFRYPSTLAITPNQYIDNDSLNVLHNRPQTGGLNLGLDDMMVDVYFTVVLSQERAHSNYCRNYVAVTTLSNSHPSDNAVVSSSIGSSMSSVGPASPE